jgi:probable rRNA maturation factor
MIFLCVDDKRWKNTIPEAIKQIRPIIKYVMKLHGYSSKYEIHIILSNDALLHNLNNEHCGKDKPTNVLSFPNNFSLQEDVKNFGEIFISLDRIMFEAEEKKIIHYNHFAHLLIHGVLHLLGYTHDKRKDTSLMEGKEIEILHTLNISNPYL